MFWENFYSLCRENNRKPLQVVNQLGIASGSITMWKNGTRPSEKNLRKLAEYFGVTPDYFFVDHSVCIRLGNTEKEKPSEEGSGGEDVVVVNRSGKRFVHHLSPEQLDILSGMIEQMEKNNQ